jgi:hypothetical protein
VGVPSLQGADRGPRAHLRRGCEPAGEAKILAPRSVIFSFYLAVDGGPPGAPTINMKTSTATTGPREVPELKVREHPPPTSTAGPWEVLEQKVRECPPSM